MRAVDVQREANLASAARLRGIGKGTWGDGTKIDAYLDKLRDEWERA